MKRRTFLAALGAVAATRQVGRRQRFDIDPVIEQGEETVTVVRFPYVQNVQSNRATIMWATREPGYAVVQYSPDGINYRGIIARGRTFSRAETGSLYNFIQYQAELTDLTPGTDYTYHVFVNGVRVAGASELRFRTAGPGPFSFLVFGDSGFGSEGQGLIAQRMAAERPALVLHTGDLVYTQGFGAQSGYELYQQRYFNYYASLMSSVPFFPCPGNHDDEYAVQSGAIYQAVHAVPTATVPAADRGRYYSFDWGNVHFVSLDSHASLARSVNSVGTMLKWLENDLRSTRKFWRVVYFHHPPYAGGENETDIHCEWGRQFLQPILETHGVQVVLSGHEHSYQRSQPLWKGSRVSADVGINYITSGGGGAIRYRVKMNPRIAVGRSEFHYMRVQVDGSRMTFQAIGADGTELDRFTISPRPMLSDLPAQPAGLQPVTALSPVRFEPSATEGSFIRILGRSLAEESLICGAAPSAELGGTSVTINGRSIELLYVSPTQIYGQLPFNVEGNITVRVTTRNGSSADISVNPG
jgi:predicted MPP superfamily phosphohydrolase